MIRTIRLPLVAAASVLAVAGAAQAQPQAPASHQPAGAQQPNIPALLHLRPDQMAAYQTFQAATRPTPEEINQMRSALPQAIAGLATPARLQRVDAALTAQLQMFHRNADATRAFYGRLSPDQQKTFDQLTTRGAGGGSGPSGG